MTMFYECGYAARMAYLTFLILTILTFLYLLWRYVYGKRGVKKIVMCIVPLLFSIGIYSILNEDHIAPLEDMEWQGYQVALPTVPLWIVAFCLFLIGTHLIMLDYEREKRSVTESNIKEAFDEVSLAICVFRTNGTPMLCNRRMQDISEMMCGRVFLSRFEFHDILAQREEWREPENIYRFPDGTVCRFAEGELVCADGVHYLVANFFDITEQDRRKSELEAQGEELRRMSVTLQKFRENVHLLAKEEEILSIKTRWHDVLGEGLTAIRHSLLSNQSMESTERALILWNDAVATIQRDNDDPDQRRDAMGDLLRNAQGLQIQIIQRGEMPASPEIQRVFILAMRNCLLNAAQHAKATELYVKITQTETDEILSVTNNGIQPESEIIPRGGLRNVQNYVGYIGGRTELRSVPRFELRIVVPRKEKPEL